MRIRAGYRLTFESPQPTPMLLVLNVHPSRRADLLSDDVATFDPPLATWGYVDGFGNICSRVVLPAGRTTASAEFEIYDNGVPDFVPRDAVQHEIKDLPDEVLVFLLGSRYCETDRLGDFAWATFGQTPPGWSRVQAICDFVHSHIAFDYANADPLRTAYGSFSDRTGVCRDFAHLAITLCRCMNVPARYCTGYLGDIGVPRDPNPMDFSGWFEAYLGGHWYTFDARHNTPRIGRILIATGRDATDVAISTSFGNSSLVQFEVITEEVFNEDPGVVAALPRASETASSTASSVGHEIPPDVRAAIGQFLNKSHSEGRAFSVAQALEAVRRTFPGLEISDAELLDAVTSEASVAGLHVDFGPDTAPDR